MERDEAENGTHPRLQAVRDLVMERLVMELVRARRREVEARVEALERVNPGGRVSKWRPHPSTAWWRPGSGGRAAGGSP